ncbi:MAG TPA: hypothetical protein VK484_11590 [Ferruginibacter sp.]|nr:hypothetical protein [Ferruginibacter sp.]
MKYVIILLALINSFCLQGQSRKKIEKAQLWARSAMWDFNYGTSRNSAPLCEYYHNGIYEGKVYPALKGQAPPQNLYVHAADDGCTICCYYKGENLANPNTLDYRDPDYAAAITYIKKSADAGFSKAAMLLGNIYELKIKNNKLAAEWYGKAAAMGDSLAGEKVKQYDIASADPFEKGMEFYRKGNFEDAFRYWSVATELNSDAYAAYNIAMLYFEGEGVEKNDRLVKFFLSKSCSFGKKDACYLAGKMYADGGDKPNALIDWEKAIRLGYPGLEEMVAKLRIEVAQMRAANEQRWAQMDADKKEADRRATERFVQQNKDFYAREAAAGNTNYSTNRPAAKRTVCWKCNGRGTIHTTLSDGAVKSGGVVVYGKNEACTACNGKGYLN